MPTTDACTVSYSEKKQIVKLALHCTLAPSLIDQRSHNKLDRPYHKTHSSETLGKSNSHVF